MSLKQAVLNVSASLQGMRGKLDTTTRSMSALQKGAAAAASPLSQLKNGSGQTATSVGKLRTAANNSDSAVRKLNTGLRTVDGSFAKSRSGSDKLKSSLDKLKSSANNTKTALQGVKKQADAVEKSVGKAGKNADKGGKSMGSLGKGLKGASLAQKGLNLAMAASPFGLIMTLLGPLIAQFVNMDKVAALVKRGLVAAWSAIKNASSSAAKMLGPLFKGVVNGFMLPSRMLIRGLNSLIGSLNRVKIKVPDWVPVIGGKGFQFNLPTLPVPQLAKGGIVQARSGGTLALLGEAGEHEAVIPLSKLERMLGSGGGLRTLASAVERLADRPVVIQVDSQEIARAVFLGQRQLARR
ncbi:hypothetical protein ACSCB1_20195 [Streptomyces europaeiscabiei]|uniref:Phage tail protein n=1 Tax=Streptomyces europaeiscabiei TaxID=146819 RepID=A0ABU4NAY6_9ACTN|nr:hypothetical protein [Streptomyces europaeiscabiei]MDX2526589.1 hypothetical protein [Streptomyces europaeiscabiei]MDX2759330.1 hypothetical protein [Streptomyces europaeiscabiei]MDX2769816.1 hypothetical protein [Streptomyces europaeiscabiei]MDX3541653.1 hypothetical protein [Streptomyces europaeiscabiei]MDX3551994.1 hypothetical protein [Streptomyces europaeiscabiei]